jgi:hypothetical protein
MKMDAGGAEDGIRPVKKRAPSLSSYRMPHAASTGRAPWQSEHADRRAVLLRTANGCSLFAAGVLALRAKTANGSILVLTILTTDHHHRRDRHLYLFSRIFKARLGDNLFRWSELVVSLQWPQIDFGARLFLPHVAVARAKSHDKTRRGISGHGKALTGQRIMRIPFALASVLFVLRQRENEAIFESVEQLIPAQSAELGSRMCAPGAPQISDIPR